MLTAPDAPHAVTIESGRALIAFVEPESELGDRLRAIAGERSSLILQASATAQLTAALTGGSLSRTSVRAALPALYALLGGLPAERRRRHPGVMRVLRHLRESAPDVDTSLEALAAIARLSPGRFMHAFTASVGLPLRPYLLWLKLERAGAALARGAALAEAANAAGFADAAHMTRTFRRMFGVTPSELQRRSQSVQDPGAG